MSSKGKTPQKDSVYKLSVALEGHQGDVRCVSAGSPDGVNDLILTASRDKKAILWSRIDKNAFNPAIELGNHNGFVNACTIVQLSGAVYALTAGQDKLINAYQLSFDAGEVTTADKDESLQARPSRILVGHQENICALHAHSRGQYIVSGSWDKTAKVWRDWECVATFKGHEQSVWAVLAVDEDRVLTASADKTIRLWSISKPAKPLAVFGGHTDAVRGLTLLEGGQSFASCGNDGNINIYSLLDASSSSSPIQPQQTLSGHTSFVYSLSTIPGGDGELVSSGEDRSVRIWKDGNLVQTVTIPAISVWSVSTLPNSDIVCGSSDSIARVFTRSPERLAEQDVLEAYEHSISTQVLNQTQVGDIQKDSLPGPEALSQPGTKEGQTKMVKNGDIVEAHQWSAASGRWEKIGEVVGGVGTGQKKLYEGKEYDYVFDVDIADGVPPLKLPFNLSENPYAAAQRFLEKNELSQEYIDQVVKFIETNTAGVSLGGEQYLDPYTGASRYQPAGASGGSTTANSAPAARPTQQTNNTDIYTGSRNVDPYTSSGGGQAPLSSTNATSATNRILPQRDFLAFRAANFGAIRTKLTQVNEQESSKLSLQEMEQVNDLINKLENGSHGIVLDVSALRKAVTSWSPGSRLPALDLIRCAAAVGTTASATDLAREAFEASSWAADWPKPGSPEAKARDVNSMLALRTIANLWNHAGYLGELDANSLGILGSLGETHFRNLSKNGRIAFATVIYNATAQMVSSPSKGAVTKITMDLINEVLIQEPEDSEVMYRAVVALGNLLCSPSINSLPPAARSVAGEQVRKWQQSGLGKEERIASICREVLELL